MSDASFEKDGKTIPFRKVSLTREGQSFEEGTPIDLVMKETGKAAKISHADDRADDLDSSALDGAVEHTLTGAMSEIGIEKIDCGSLQHQALGIGAEESRCLLEPDDLEIGVALRPPGSEGHDGDAAAIEKVERHDQIVGSS